MLIDSLMIFKGFFGFVIIIIIIFFFFAQFLLLRVLGGGSVLECYGRVPGFTET